MHRAKEGNGIHTNGGNNGESDFRAFILAASALEISALLGTYYIDLPHWWQIDKFRYQLLNYSRKSRTHK